MFTTPTPPSRYATWPRYNEPTHPSSSSLELSHLTHQQRQQQLSAEESDVLSSSSPTQSYSSPLLQTPFTFRSNTYSTNPLASPITPSQHPDNAQLIASPEMPAYPDTPSSPSSYGISGAIMGNGVIMGSGTAPATSCARVIPSHQDHSHHHLSSDPFMVAPSCKQQHPRPALRPSLSHNAIFQIPYPRRMMPNVDTSTTSTASVATPAPSALTNISNTTSIAAAAVNEAGRPSTAGTVLDAASTSIAYSSNELSTSAPSTTPLHLTNATSHQQGIHEAASGTPFATLPTSTATHSTSSSYPPAHSTIPLHSSTSYSDAADASFSTSYSYDASFSSASSGSPWPQQPHHGSSPHLPPQHQLIPPQYYGHPLYEMYPSGKQLEPILAPGEIPAPRPPMSYAALIGEALLLAAPPHHLYVSEISDSIKKRYAYYGQNPSKIYNGVRHQTSMCKAFVKLPRPFGDQSGGARKWAIRAGCEAWFTGGGYHPPSSSPVSSATSVARGKSSGKAKATARSKQLAIGTTSPPSIDKKMIYDDAVWSPGPSSGPAFDGSGRPFLPSFQPPPQYAAAAPAYNLPPGYHYIPVSHPHYQHQQYAQHGHHHQQQQPMYMPLWAPYQAPPPPASSASTIPSMYRSTDIDSNGSPEHWREESHPANHSAPSEHGSHMSTEEKPVPSPAGTTSPEAR